MHLIDMIQIGLLNETWPSRFPMPLAQRLQALLDDPDGQVEQRCLLGNGTSVGRVKHGVSCFEN